MINLTRLNVALEQGLSKSVFDHVRNYLICSTIFAIGVIEYKQKPGFFLGIEFGDHSGLGIIVMAFLLFLLNLYDGIRQISNSKFHKVLIGGLIFFYVVMSIRVMELAWYFAINP